MLTIHFIGRIIFGAYFVYNAYNHFKNAKGYTMYAKHKGVPQPALAVNITGLLLLVGGIGFFLNIFLSQASAILLLFMVPTTLIMHAFWKEKDPAVKSNELIAFTKNLAIIGALLMML